MTALASGQHVKYFEDVQNAFTPEGIAAGNSVLANLFGSKELSRAIAAHAAQSTGIAQEVFKQMLPVVASMMMGGLFKQSTSPQAGNAAGNPLGDMIAQMMRQGGAMMGVSPSQREQPNPFDNPFGRALQDMFGGRADQTSAASAAPKEPGAGLFDNPWVRIFDTMMSGGQPPEPTKEKPARKADAGPKPETSPYGDLFGQMFEAGRDMRHEYQKSVEALFDQFSKGIGRNGS
jgi:hypothetical protein